MQLTLAVDATSLADGVTYTQCSSGEGLSDRIPSEKQRLRVHCQAVAEMMSLVTLIYPVLTRSTSPEVRGK